MMFIILAEGSQIPPPDVAGTAVEEPVVSWLLGACVQGWDRPGRDQHPGLSVLHWALLGAFSPPGKPHVTAPSYRAVASNFSCGVGPLLGPAEVQVDAGHKFKPPTKVLPG